jgi:Ca2+-binding RTX toxin-like protein
MITLYGDNKNDELIGSDGADTLYGYGGDDILKGGEGDDKLKGGEGNDTLDGGDGDDKLYGGAGNNNLLGGLGNDYLSVFLKTGENILNGGGGDDKLIGGEESDTLDGGDGGDKLYGYGGDDILKGGEGDDELYGGEGNDTLDGGPGYNLLWGEANDDSYVISSRDFDLIDFDGNDSAIIKTDFVKIPSTIENVSYAAGVKALPYWIDALIADRGASFLSFLGDQKQYSYGYPQLIPDYIESNSEYINGWVAFNSAQRLLSDSALSYIDSLLDVSFKETDDYAQLNVITFANNWQEGTDAYARRPSSTFNGSDFYYNRKNIDKKFTEGEWAATAFLHELGHALGLKHPFSGEDNLAPYLSEFEDNTKWTEMSYTKHSTEDYLLQFSPFDIAALQYLYGPDKNSRAGNDTYVFDPYQPNFIWDGAGVDLIDASTSNEGVSIYLTPGDWSFKGTKNSELISSAGQLTINFGTEIENLLGSGFNDKLFGNELANELKGGSGDDYLYGYSGNDLISGGVGKDILSGGSGVDTFLFQGESELGDIITDFTTGVGGDELKVGPLLASLGYSGSNPYSEGWLELEQSGTDLKINLDSNGGGDGFNELLVTLKNVLLSDFMTINDVVADLDYAYQITSSSDESAVGEGNPIEFTIERSGNGSSSSTVYFSTTDDTANAGSDFGGIDKQKIEFLPNQTSKTVTVQTYQDSETEGDEYFWFDLYTNEVDVEKGLYSSFARGHINDVVDETTSADKGFSSTVSGVSTTVSTQKTLYGSASNDTLDGFSGYEVIDGKGGLDVAKYSVVSDAVSFSKNGAGQLVVQNTANASESDILVSVERIQFSDKNYALDLDGNAGIAAKAIIASFGAENLNAIMSPALSIIDGGMTLNDVCDLVVNYQLIENVIRSNSNGAFVDHIYKNVAGVAPSQADHDTFTALLDNGTYTKSSLLSLAARLTEAQVTTNSIDLIGVSGSADGEILALQYDLGLG